jgi:hypothetical protein
VCLAFVAGMTTLFGLVDALSSGVVSMVVLTVVSATISGRVARSPSGPAPAVRRKVVTDAIA